MRTGATLGTRGDEDAAMTSAPRKPVLGLVGGIGAGKSTVANALARHGGKVVAGDPLGHEAPNSPTSSPASPRSGASAASSLRTARSIARSSAGSSSPAR